MASAESRNNVIVRRSGDGEDVVKGGAWKIAHADFHDGHDGVLSRDVADQSDRRRDAKRRRQLFPILSSSRNRPRNKKGLDDPQNVPPTTRRTTPRTARKREAARGPAESPTSCGNPGSS